MLAIAGSSRRATEISATSTPSDSHAARAARSSAPVGIRGRPPSSRSTVIMGRSGKKARPVSTARAGRAPRDAQPFILRAGLGRRLGRLGQVSGLRVVDAVVVDAAQHLDELLLDLADLLERERR